MLNTFQSCFAAYKIFEIMAKCLICISGMKTANGGPVVSKATVMMNKIPTTLMNSCREFLILCYLSPTASFGHKTDLLT